MLEKAGQVLILDDKSLIKQGSVPLSIEFSGGMTDDERIISTRQLSEDETENSLRPKSMADYIGQKKAKENLSIYIQAAKMRGESLDHTLLYGPPGLGKTQSRASFPQ